MRLFLVVAVLIIMVYTLPVYAGDVYQNITTMNGGNLAGRDINTGRGSGARTQKTIVPQKISVPQVLVGTITPMKIDGREMVRGGIPWNILLLSVILAILAGVLVLRMARKKKGGEDGGLSSSMHPSPPPAGDDGIIDVEVVAPLAVAGARRKQLRSDKGGGAVEHRNPPIGYLPEPGGGVNFRLK